MAQTRAIVVGAAAIAALALFGAASPDSAGTPVAPEPARATALVSPQSPLTAPTMAGGRVIAVDDNGNSVNDQGQTSGDIFTQNAQDQSTA